MSLRAVDVAALVEGCVPGEPLQVEQPDMDVLAAFYERFYELVGHPNKTSRQENTQCHPDTPPEPRTSYL